MNAYIMVLLAVALLAVNFALTKLYQMRMGAGIKNGLKLGILGSFFSAVIYFCVNGFKLAVAPYSIIISVVAVILSTSYGLIGLKVLKSSNMAFYTLSLMAGGMTVPYIFGIIFLNEQFSVLRFVGLLFILFAVVSSNLTGEKVNGKLIAYCVAVFILNGLLSVVLKLHQIEATHETASAMEFVVYQGTMNVILSSITLAALNKRIPNEESEKPKGTLKTVIAIAAGSAAVSGLSSVFQLLGASKLPASVLYPMITGGTIILTSLAGVIFFKEKLSKKMIMCIIICFIGTCLFL